MLVRSLHDVPVCREKRVTRAFDVGISSALLLITLPVIAFTAILVCLESPGPVFERQRRIGKAGRPFALLRFRTRSIAPEPHRATEKPARYTRVACPPDRGKTLFCREGSMRIAQRVSPWLLVMAMAATGPVGAQFVEDVPTDRKLYVGEAELW